MEITEHEILAPGFPPGSVRPRWEKNVPQLLIYRDALRPG